MKPDNSLIVFTPGDLITVSKDFGIFRDTSDNLFILQRKVPVVEDLFSSWILKRTEEIRLNDIGRFPLKKEDEPLLEYRFMNTTDKSEYTLPLLLKRSHTPIFFAQEKTEAILPPAGQKVCRYFFDLWDIQLELPDTRLEPDLLHTLFGFAIISSFV